MCDLGSVSYSSVAVPSRQSQSPVDFWENKRHLVEIVARGVYKRSMRLFIVLGELQRQLGNELRFAFRHYPLSGIHPHAQLAAEAAEAAGAQGRFWEMHNMLFEYQNALSPKDLARYAERIGLDVKKFRSDLKEHRFEDRVRGQFRRGVQNRVYGTPGLFVNEVRYAGKMD